MAFFGPRVAAQVIAVTLPDPPAVGGRRDFVPISPGRSCLIASPDVRIYPQTAVPADTEMSSKDSPGQEYSTDKKIV